MDLYQQFIHKSRYAKYIPSLKRREHWEETVDRYLSFNKEHLQENYGYTIPDDLYEELKYAILNHEVMPSMRAMMTAGKALKRDNTCGYNPVRKGTLVLTKEHGLVSIETLNSASVLNMNGEWTPATFRGYGNQSISRVKLKLNSNTEKYVDCTINHRWYLTDGRVVATQDLTSGDKISFVSPIKKEYTDIDYLYGVRHGIIFGDGSATYSCGRVKGYVIRICSDAEDLMPFFDGYNVSYPASAKGDPYIYMYDDFAKTHDLKTLPNVELETDSYLLGFMRGWFAADGYVSISGQVSLAVSEQNLKWIKQYADRIGFVIQSVSEYPEKTNYGKRNHRLYRVSFSRSSITDSDILISRKRERHKPIKSIWHVVGVEHGIDFDDVYCAEVPDTNTFVLDQGLLTGNCAFVAIDDPKAFDEAMHILMCGTGVGFSVERQYINKLPEIPDRLFASDTIITVKDSKEGWAKSFRLLLAMLYSGEIPKWDLTLLRPAGAVLKTMGGRSSGPQPLDDLFHFTVRLFQNAVGRRLTSLECHDLMCKIGDIVVVGGVRRCLPSGSMVHTETGMKPIETVVPGLDKVLTTDGYRLVKEKFNQGIQRLLTVKTQDSEFRCTENHKIAVLISPNEYVWKMAKDLEFGDRVIAPSVSIKGMKTELPKFSYSYPEHSTTCKSITIPELDNDIAWLLGIIHGDGYIRLTPSSGEVSISFAKHQRVNKDRAEIALNRFGVYCSTIEYENYFVLRVKSKQLAQYFHAWLKQPKKEIKIPECIWLSSDNIKKSYLQGIFDSDGSYKTRPIQLVVSVYKKFCEDLRKLASSCGIQLRLKALSTSNLKSTWQRKYAVVFVNNRAKECFGLEASIAEQRTNTYPKDWKISKSSNDFPWSKTDFELIPVAVIDVVDDDVYEQTWDIEVDDKHEFFCEGYLMHNSAMISLSNLSDDRMRNAKHGAWWEQYGHRALSNNSAVYSEKPDVGMFMREWLALYDSKSGERGIFSREASKAIAAKNGRRKSDFEFGTNPCSEIILRSMQFCVAENTPLITETEIAPIVAFVNKEVNIWNGKEWTPVTVRKTGSDQKLMRVYLNDGSYLDCTPDHRWSVKDRFSDEWKEVQTKDLMKSKYSLQVEPASVVASDKGSLIDDAYTIGFAVGDGCVYNGSTIIDLYGAKDWQCPVKGSRHAIQYNHNGTPRVRCIATKFANPNLILSLKNDPEFLLSCLGSWNTKSVLNFIAGLADADGSETTSGGIRIYINGYEKGRAIQLLLAKHGIRCSVNLHQKEGTETNLGVRKRDSYYVQITDCSRIPCHRLDVSSGHEPKFKGKYQNILRVEELDGLHDTYCFEEPKTHKGMFGNVLTYQCNLSEVICRADDTEKTLQRKIRLATILGTFQSSLTHFPYLRRQWTRNTEEERLLGVSLTGIYDNPFLSDYNDKKLPKRLEMLRQIAIDTNKEYAEILEIPQSTAITCVKPSGTVSQLTNSASGIHPRHSIYYIRRVRQDNKDPLTRILIDAGIPHEPDVTKPHATTIFSFPVKGSDRTKLTRDDITALDHLKLWLVYQRHWCEHKPSVTISVKENEWPEVGAWVWNHFDEVSGISFLPYDGGTYKQAPYETITEEDYNKFFEQMPKEIDWNSFVEDYDASEGTQTLACTAGGCEL